MTKAELIARCAELDIDINTIKAKESGKPTNAELKAAIKTKEGALELNELVNKANALGIDTTSFDADPEVYKKAILEKEEDVLFEELKAQAAILEIDITNLETSEQLQEAIDNKKAFIKDQHKNAKTSYTDKDGGVWVFKKDTPKTLNVDGVPRSQREIMEDESIIAWLVQGKNSYLKRKK